MRPLRLELHGFTTFRRKTVVDFEGAELFAFTGNTGAGKSSLIDAIVFVLYGVVPRYDDRRKVAPVVSQGMVEARIGLDFSVGADTYTAVRVVRRNPKGDATTKEATLERTRPGRDSEVLAATADEVTARVTELLGLAVDHFTRCVVLPQGEFARFLLDKPKDRRELLVNLLDLGIYETMGQKARERSTRLKTHVELLDRHLEELGDVGDAAVGTARRKAEATSATEEAFADAEPRLAALDAARKAAQDEAAKARKAIEALDRLEMPDAVEELAVALVDADERRDTARKAEAAAAGERDRADLTVSSLPPRADLDGLVRAYAERERLTREIAASEEGLAPKAAAEAAAVSDDEAAEAAVAAAESHLQDVRHEHLAHTLAEALVAGAPCPVCEQEVRAVPALVAPPEKAAAQQALGAATERRKETASALERCRGTLHKATGMLDQLRSQLAGIEAGLAEAPALEVARESINRLDAAEAEAKAAREAHDRARNNLDAAQRNHDTVRAAVEDARLAYGRARDGVAAYGPPEPGQDLRADWVALVEWGAAQRPDRVRTCESEEAAAADAGTEHAKVVALLVEQARGAGIEAASLPELRRRVSNAAGQARTELAAVVASARKAAGMRDERRRVEGERVVADTLGLHLKSNNFQAWLLREALETLVAGATELLKELSGGAYSFKLADKDDGFDVIDHRNADEARSARTLSGGETFLASLALALALGDRIAQMAAHGAARLESLFLDEGFGTLDSDTLDVVAAAIEELGSRGRTVGLVTHVRDLAERVPVRFEVVKEPTGSTVTRVDT